MKMNITIVLDRTVSSKIATLPNTACMAHSVCLNFGYAKALYMLETLCATIL